MAGSSSATRTRRVRSCTPSIRRRPHVLTDVPDPLYRRKNASPLGKGRPVGLRSTAVWDAMPCARPEAGHLQGRNPCATVPIERSAANPGHVGEGTRERSQAGQSSATALARARTGNARARPGGRRGDRTTHAARVHVCRPGVSPGARARRVICARAIWPGRSPGAGGFAYGRRSAKWDHTRKAIAEVINPGILTAPLVELGLWMGEYYAHSPGLTLAALVPAASRRPRFKRVAYLQLTGREPASEPTPKQRALLAALAEGPRRRDEALAEAGVGTLGAFRAGEAGPSREDAAAGAGCTQRQRARGRRDGLRGRVPKTTSF